MLIPVVLKDGHEELVSKEELPFLLLTKKICSLNVLMGGQFLGERECETRKSHTMVKIDESAIFIL